MSINQDLPLDYKNSPRLPIALRTGIIFLASNNVDQSPDNLATRAFDRAPGLRKHQPSFRTELFSTLPGTADRSRSAACRTERRGLFADL